jgi:hypothetical protein
MGSATGSAGYQTVPVATVAAPGLYQAGAAPGSISGTAVAAGKVGEQIFNSGSAISVGSGSNTVTSIVLTPGVWLISAGVQNNGVAGNNYLVGAISLTNNSLAGTTYGIDKFLGAVQNANGVGQVTIPNKYVNITVSTQYFLVANLPAATSACDGSISGVRIA